MDPITPTISQTKSGFPDYLDFTKMRSDVINYLGPVTSAYWTDYNEHDPGITTLEMLIYALMDLGYRVNWPIADLLTQKTGVPETDFLTPAQVLGSNPFTINDYRKRLMDLKEVRNAWLKPAGAPATTLSPGAPATRGLYEVRLELESDATDFATEEEYQKYRDGVVLAVKTILQAHRNLCEDFLEPVVMSRQPWYVTADIELETGATPPVAYAALIKALYNFFSPVPNYYTLAQLLANQVSLDQVFAGRPYERRPSFGFLLDSELPDLPGEGTRKIYASEVLNVLLDTTGVDAVQQLNVGPVSSFVKSKKTGFGTVLWSLPLDAETLPVLSVGACQFRWFLNGQQLSWTPATSAAQLQKTLAYSGKVLYPFGSPELDSAVPAGTYLDGLGNYYSIQKDFPEVYGIGPGGLPGSANPLRQAQAMQFKGYLLFFEQLMADFLARLGNVRSLLSMQGVAAAAPGSEEDDDPEDRTGWGPDIDPQGSIGAAPGNGPTGAGGSTSATWHGNLSDVPGLSNLLLFPPGDETSVTLAYPVAADKWNELLRKGPVSHEDVQKLEPFAFTHWHDRDLAVAELALAFTVMPPVPTTVPLKGGKKWVFAIAGIRRDLVLLSSSMYNTRTDASGAAASALYAGSSKEYYTLSVLTEKGKVGYSFTLGQSGLDYYDYVDQLTANPQVDVQQRTGYLLHLIGRFAETYDDYAQLSAGFLTTQTIAANQVGLMQQFLSRLPALGADRGKAYNYTRRSWDNTNVSGFEQRFKAYCGIADRRRHYLCPFEVVPADQGGYIYRLTDKDRPRAYHVLGKDAEKVAAEAARAALIVQGRAGYIYPDFYVNGENILFKKDGFHYRIHTCTDYFHQLYAGNSPLFGRGREWTLFESIQAYPTADAAQEAFQNNYLHILDKVIAAGDRFNDQESIGWEEHGQRLAVAVVGEELRDTLAQAGLNVAQTLVKAAREYPIRRIERRKGFGYQLWNENGTRDWISAGRFGSVQDAHDALQYTLLLMQVAANYFIDYDDEECRYRVGIREVLAESTASFTTEEKAWGPDGVQRFIGVAQTAGGWHPEEREECVWGYFVACPNEKAIHPCRYETKEERDDAMERLQDDAQKFPAGEWMEKEGNEIVLRDPGNRHRVAKFPAGSDAGPVGSDASPVGSDASPVGIWPDETTLDTVLDLLDAVWAGSFYEDEQGLYVQAGQIQVRPGHQGVGRDKWEPELLHYGAYFPIVRTRVVGAAAQYRVEIKLRGFAALPGKSHAAGTCYAAWIRPGAPPGSAVEAWQSYEALRPLLKVENNYRPVHDKAALLYGIELLEETAILARGIQPYWYAEMAARGLDRASALVNAEGLNLVEHVLLRKDTIPVCPPESNPPLTNPNFQPGADPYSFIMTVFLPAWPQRFRKKENRQLLETILQREAPAHVLPRILWLTPGDMCRMESAYKKWLNWLGTKKPCGDFKPDDFIGLLFNTPFECMEDVGCGQSSKNAAGDNWLSQIDQLYCWADQECADTSGWKSAASGGSDSTPANIPILIGGTKLERPARVKPVPEPKPKPPERKPVPTQPTGRKHRPSIWKKLMQRVEKVWRNPWEHGLKEKLEGFGNRVLKWARLRP